VVGAAPEAFQWTEDSAASWILPVSDPDGDPWVFEAPLLPSWLRLRQTANGLSFEGTPTLSSQAGQTDVTVRVSDGKSGAASQVVRITVTAVNDSPTAAAPSMLAVDEDGMVPAVRLRELFDDEEDTAAGLTFEMEPPLEAAFSDWQLDPVTAEFTGNLNPDFNGLVRLAFRATDTGGLVASTTVTLNVLPVPDAPRAPATLPAPEVSEDGAPVTVELGPSFSDVDAGDVLRFSVLSNDQADLFSDVSLDAASGRLILTWAAYRWGTAVLVLRGTDKDGLFADTLLTVTLPAPPEPEVLLRGQAKLNRQTGLIEQSVTVKNLALRPVGGFILWVDGGAGASLFNGVEGSTLSPEPPAPWAIPYSLPLAAGAATTIVLEFYSVRRMVSPATHGAEVINGAPRQAPAGAEDGTIPVSRIVATRDGPLIEFPSMPGASYLIESSEDNRMWTVSPTPIRAGGTAVQWLDRGPPFTPNPPADTTSRYYRVRSGPTTPLPPR